MTKKELRHKYILNKARLRGDASILWHKEHPEGITKKNLLAFKKFIKEYEKNHITTHST